MPNAEASMTKVVTTELQAKLAAAVLDLAGADASGASTPDQPFAVTLALHMYRQAPYLRFGGGTNEIQRDIIAQRGLGLPPGAAPELPPPRQPVGSRDAWMPQRGGRGGAPGVGLNASWGGWLAGL